MQNCSAEAYVSMKRVQEFLLRSESKQESVKSTEAHSGRAQNVTSLEKSVRFEKVTAVWKQSVGHISNGIFDVSVEIKPGLCAIVGPTGSGKSSLLNVILGELGVDSGTVTINGSISYASQANWIFEGSIRNNIVFVEDFDEKRYKKVVEVCALEQDFKIFPQRDLTIVSEGGSSLSGGQRARINLARAIYKQSDIYLLDSPLSALDPHVAKHIFEKCFEQFLKGKICVLVTHQLERLQNVQQVITLNNGRINIHGSVESFHESDSGAFMYNQEAEVLKTPQSPTSIVS